MACPRSPARPSSFEVETIPTATMIENIPMEWEIDHLVHLMTRMKLPPPKTLKFLYDNSDSFRGMAFATFASWGEARQMIQVLNYHRVPGGGRLNVQYESKCREDMAAEIVTGGVPPQSDHYPHIGVQDQTYTRPQAEASLPPTSIPRSTRGQTPPFESYDLLMSYQKQPREKEKLRRFLAETGDYQEAVNEFAKNRAWESQAWEHRRKMGRWPVLEMRPAKLEDEQRIAAMESEFGLVGEGCLSASLTGNHEGAQEIESMMKNRLPESIKPDLVEGKREEKLRSRKQSWTQRRMKKG